MSRASDFSLSVDVMEARRPTLKVERGAKRIANLWVTDCGGVCIELEPVTLLASEAIRIGEWLIGTVAEGPYRFEIEAPKLKGATP